MKYSGMPMGMWLLFAGSFRKQLEEVLRYDDREALEITKKANVRYRELIEKLPELRNWDCKNLFLPCAVWIIP